MYETPTGLQTLANLASLFGRLPKLFSYRNLNKILEKHHKRARRRPHFGLHSLYELVITIGIIDR